MVLLWLLIITIHKLNFFSHLTHFLSNIFSFYVLVTKAVQMTKLSPYRNKPGLRCSYQRQNQETDLIPFAPCKKIRIPEPGKFCSANPEYGIQLKEYANPLEIGIRNPSSRMTRSP